MGAFCKAASRCRDHASSGPAQATQCLQQPMGRPERFRTQAMAMQKLHQSALQSCIGSGKFNELN
jgi:hypothetical protein